MHVFPAPNDRQTNMVDLGAWSMATAVTILGPVCRAMACVSRISADHKSR